MTALTELNKAEDELFKRLEKTIAIATRIGHHAKKEDFSAYIRS
jgi:hypothetical protein